SRGPCARHSAVSARVIVVAGPFGRRRISRRCLENVERRDRWRVPCASAARCATQDSPRVSYGSRRMDMSRQLSASLLVIALLLPASIAAQAPRRAARSWTPPLTADGAPDLQGVWNTATLTPFERPTEFAGKPFLTEAEVAAYEQQMAVQNNRDRRDSSPQADVGGAYNDFWFERGSRVVPSRRT